MYIYQWPSSTEKKLASIPVEQLKVQQTDLEASLLKIVLAAAPYPTPGRATRNAVARWLIRIYIRGETGRLFDTTNAALSCVGDLIAVYGAQYMSFMAEITVVTLKTSKSSSTALLRYHALLALKKSLDTAKRAVTNSALKDIVKQMKSLLNDKCSPVNRAAAEVLISLFSGSDDGRNLILGDADSILGLAVKSMDGADRVTRQSLSRLIERAVSNKKDMDANDECASSPIQAAEMQSHLSSHFNKPNTTRKLRIGLFDCYVALFNNLGSVFVENNYALIIVSNPRNNTTLEIVLRDLIGGQIGATRELSTSYIKRWPAIMPGQTSPTSSVLVVVLREVAVQDALAEPLNTLLAHSSHTTRVTASWDLRCFCYSTPLRLPKTIMTVIEMLQRVLTSILSPTAPSDIDSRTLGHAYGLAALVSIIRERPFAKVLDIVEVEVSWILIASLMSLGPNFVRPHLPQLLDSAKQRESALGAIHCFLQHNTTLVNLDVGRRIASVLGNPLSFANSFITLNIEQPLEPPLPSTFNKGLSLNGREALLRRRVYQCFSILGFSGITDSTQSTPLQSVVILFASPEGYSGSTVQAAIASSSGSFTSVWQSVDGYAYGVTFTEVADDSVAANDAAVNEGDKLNRDTVELAIDKLLRKPVLAGCEHDPLNLCQIDVSKTEYRIVESPLSATSVVDSAINLFADLILLQNLSSIIRTITHLLDFVRSSKLEKNVRRKAAVLINAAIALVLTLRSATTSHYREITNLLSLLLKEILVDRDHVLRSASSESIGRLAGPPGTNFLTSQMKSLYKEVVNNRDAYARSACALSFGAVHDHVGGLAAGAVLQTTVGVLMSLSNDTHPVVHFFALNALARVINAASLAYSPFVSKTLGMLLQLYSSESHEPEGGTLCNANLSGDYLAYPVVCQIIDAVITIVGPDIQDSVKTRALLLDLVHGFFSEDDQGVLVEAIKCQQHFLMFAADFRGHLSSSRRPLKVASINAFYQLVQKDALVLSKLGGDRLVEDLFGMLDDDSSVDGVRNVITSRLEQTVVYNPSAWIDLCQRIMSRTNASQQITDAANARDDEGESLNLGNQEDGGRSRQTSRWRTQLFALQCLHHICTVVSKSGRREHLDIIFAKSRDITTSGLLVTRVPDLIKMAFTASTAYVTEIRLEGLIVLRDVIQIFAKSPDPAFEDALLLKQHQSPITAALTPAFSTDSTPEILASAVHACVTFVGCGVVKHESSMGRILKLLTVALEQSKDSGMVSLGETGELSPNGSAMLRISALSAWPQLAAASYQQAYLLNVVKPYRPILATMWIAALRDYASIRVDSEFLQNTLSAALDSTYSSLGKEVLLPAIASSMQVKDPYIIAAMDGREQEPITFFYTVFGLVYEEVAEASTDSLANSATHQASVIASLQALKSLIRPEYAGKAILDPTIFDEFISVCYRLAMTESALVQIHLIEVLTVFAASQGSRTSENMSASSPESHCLRICAHILRHSTSHSSGPIIWDVADRVKMILAAFSAFATVAVGTSIAFREDLRSDELNEIDLAGLAFRSLKVLLDLPLASNSDAQQRYQRLIHGLLSACLLNIDEMRGRQGAACTKKVKNNLLAAVLVLTAISPTIKVGHAVVEHCCLLIPPKLLETHEVSLTAAHCGRTLIAASASGNVLLRCCVKLLMPALIEYIAKMVPLVNNGSISENHGTAISEVWKPFAIFFGSLTEGARKFTVNFKVPAIHNVFLTGMRLLGVFLPTISLHLVNSQNSPSCVVAQCIKQLPSYATISSVAFKEAASKLDAPTRELMEFFVRRAVGGPQITLAQITVKPQISLRSF
ncbi:clathrin-coated vesicle protein [Lentinula edodes]|nr:clathrin-coated vesicle protein [Lentinula edodes]